MSRPMIRSAAQASRLASRPATRGYATESSSGNSLLERAQALGTSIAKSAERALGSYAEPIKYNLRVAGALAKQVYVSEKLAPPTSPSTWMAAYRQMYQAVSNPSWWSHTLPAGQWRRVAIHGVEAIGIFSIGEMIGKRKIVGYKIDTHGKDVAAAH